MVAIKKVKDFDGQQMFPVTHERAVRDDNGTTLETKLQNMQQSVNNAVQDAHNAAEEVLGLSVKTIPQVLTDEQKEQAQKNIGVDSLLGHFSDAGTGVNLFDADSAVTGKMLDSDGVPSVDNAAFDTSDFIPVDEGKIYRFYTLRNGSSVGNQIRCYALYDESKTKVSAVTTAGTTYIEIPAGVSYMRVTVNNASGGYADQMVYEGVFTPTYEPFKKLYNLTDVMNEELDALINKDGKGNVFNASTIISGYKFNDSDGRFFQSNSAFFTTRPINVRGYDKLLIYNEYANTFPRNTVTYKDGEIVGQYNTTAQNYSSSAFILRDTPLGVRMVYLDVSDVDDVALSIDNRCLDSLAIYRTCGEFFTPFISAFKARVPNESISNVSIKDIRYKQTYLSGKKMAAIGDSITAGYSLTSIERPWPFFVGSDFNAEMLNYGIGGSEIAVFQPDDMTYNPMCIRYADMDDNAELILVAGGTNDWGHGHTQLGTMGDTSVNTFYGALDVLCRGLLAKYPGKDIIFITPIKRWPNKGSLIYYQPNALGYTLTDFVNAIKEVCAFYGIPVIDLYEKCPINPLIDAIYTNYLPDGTHPNFAGQRLMSRYIAGGINGLLFDVREL